MEAPQSSGQGLPENRAKQPARAEAGVDMPRAIAQHFHAKAERIREVQQRANNNKRLRQEDFNILMTASTERQD